MQCTYYTFLLLALLTQVRSSTDHLLFRRPLSDLASSSPYVIRGRVVGEIDRTNMTYPLATVDVECLLKGCLPARIQLRGLGSNALGTFGIDRGIMFIHSCNSEKTECVLQYHGVPLFETEDMIKTHLGVTECLPPDSTRNSESKPETIDRSPSCDCGSGPCSWLASVNDDSGKRLCDGTLIGDKWILTAARCVAGKDSGSLRIRLPTTANLVVKAVRLHPQYSHPVRGKGHDVALLRLANATAASQCSQFRVPFGKAKPAQRAQCRVFVSTPFKEIPFKATVKKQCVVQQLRKTIFSFRSSSAMGATKVRRFASPLVCRVSKSKPWELYGIASAADNCAQSGYSAFISVTASRIGKWLEKQIAQ